MGSNAPQRRAGNHLGFAHVPDERPTADPEAGLGDLTRRLTL